MEESRAVVGKRLKNLFLSVVEFDCFMQWFGMVVNVIWDIGYKIDVK